MCHVRNECLFLSNDEFVNCFSDVNVFDFENDPSGKALSHCVRKRVTPSIRHDQNLFSS